MNEIKLNIDDRSKLSKFIIDGAPTEWFSYAEELMEAAELLWQKSNSVESEIIYTEIENKKNQIVESRKISAISRTYFLLVGFAIENLLKGYIVLNTPSTITQGKISKKLKSHKITNLVKEISEINLSNEELEICKKIEEAIPYWGRYPIPLKYTGIAPDIGVTSKIRKIIKGMYHRLALQLYNEVKNGWESGTGERVDHYFIKKYE